MKIEGRLFLDLFPMELDSKKTDEDPKENAFYKLHLVPAHTFMLVKQIQPTLRMAFLNPSWAKDYLKAHPDAVRHEKVDHDEIVLTAPTKELQAFVLKHEKDADAFATLDPMTAQGRCETVIRQKNDGTEKWERREGNRESPKGRKHESCLNSSESGFSSWPVSCR